MAALQLINPGGELSGKPASSTTRLKYRLQKNADQRKQKSLIKQSHVLHMLGKSNIIIIIATYSLFFWAVLPSLVTCTGEEQQGRVPYHSLTWCLSLLTAYSQKGTEFKACGRIWLCQVHVVYSDWGDSSLPFTKLHSSANSNLWSRSQCVYALLVFLS